MMTPRSVTMGNKVYKLHVKHGSNKKTLNMSPSATVQQLKQEITENFQVPESNQQLIFNGKTLQLNDASSLKQCRIPNGSKIVVQSLSGIPPERTQVTPNLSDPRRTDNNTQSPNPTNLPVNNSERITEQASVDGPQVSSGEGDCYGNNTVASTELFKSLQHIEDRGLQIEKLVNQLELDLSKLNSCPLEQRDQLIRTMKKQNCMNGELLMNELESLDQLRIETEMTEVRAYRKRLANLLNRVLDLNDENMQNIKSKQSRPAKDL